MKHIIVVGGGAAGMMAAIAASGANSQVTLLEQNEKTGKKLFITGKGRCNLTNACERDTFFDHIINNGKFLYSAFDKLDNNAVMELFRQAGCPLKEERGERVFPVSDHSSDVLAALNHQMRKNGVKIMLNTHVTQLLTANDLAEESAKMKGVKLSNGQSLMADAVILATGGCSYQTTGSTGEGYEFAKACGHTLKETKPALVPFTIKEDWCMKMQGLSLKNVEIRLKVDKKTIYEGFGEMLFTHFGVSGPLILTASSFYVKKHQNIPAQLIIDLKPALTVEQLDKRLLRDFEENKNKQFKTILEGLLPSKMIPIIAELVAIAPDKKINEITRIERERLIQCLKNLTMTVTGTRGFQEAIITQGGINVKEINPSTMESKLVKGLYLAGEMLDVDAVTGGFNLQIAWSTGYLAGLSAAQATQ